MHIVSLGCCLVLGRYMHLLFRLYALCVYYFMHLPYIICICVQLYEKSILKCSGYTASIVCSGSTVKCNWLHCWGMVCWEDMLAHEQTRLAPLSSFSLFLRCVEMFFSSYIYSLNTVQLWFVALGRSLFGNLVLKIITWNHSVVVAVGKSRCLRSIWWKMG